MEENSARDKRSLKEDGRELSSLKTSTWSSKNARTERCLKTTEASSHKAVAATATAQGDVEKEGLVESFPLSTWSERETRGEKEETSKCAL